jgi:hypothetical protein
MTDYKPSNIVSSLCKKLNAIPLAESDRLKTEGVLVIVVADGRKLKFTNDDITRTLTEPDPAAPKSAVVDTLEDEYFGKQHESEVINAMHRARNKKGAAK